MQDEKLAIILIPILSKITYLHDLNKQFLALNL